LLKLRSKHGTALLLLLVIVTILTLLMGFMLKSVLDEIHSEQKVFDSYRLRLLSEGAIYQTLAQYRSGQLPLEFTGSKSFNEKVTKVQVTNFGFLKILTAISTEDDLSDTTIGWLGYYADDLFPGALMMESPNPVVVLSQGSSIQGDVYLNDLDLQYTPKQGIHSDIIHGEVFNTDNYTLPKLNNDYLRSITASTDSLLESAPLNNYSHFQTRDAIVDVFNYPLVYIEGDVTLQSSTLLSLNSTTIIIIKGSLTLGQNISLANPQETQILATGNIIFQANATGKNLFCYSQQNIIATDSVRIQGQLYTGQDILIKNRAKFTYPSFLGTTSSDEDSPEGKSIQILDEAGVNGFVFVGDHEAFEQDNRLKTSQANRIQLQTKSLFTGGIYSPDVAEVYNQINGFLATRLSLQNLNHTIWWNYLKQVSIQRDDLPIHYAIPPIFQDKSHLNIIYISKNPDTIRGLLTGENN